MPDEDRESVARALRAVGLEPSQADVAALADDYPALRAMADLLYEVDEAKDELPDLTFDVRR
jgi:hypothetical protein